MESVLSILNLHSNMVLLQSPSHLWFIQPFPHLHSNMVLLQWLQNCGSQRYLADLHSNMVLLQLILRVFNLFFHLFTFQYGSTSIEQLWQYRSMQMHLHSNMVLLQLDLFNEPEGCITNLHSNMVLLQSKPISAKTLRNE